MIGLASRLLSVGPSVTMEGDQVVARSSWLWRVLSLGGWSRTVRLVPDQYIVIDDRSFWLRRTVRTVPVSHVDHLLYEYDEVPTSIGFDGRTHDAIERYLVSIVLDEGRGGERIDLFSFVGEGGAGDLGTLLTGDDLLDWVGTQDDESRRFVGLLRHATGKTIGADIPALTDAEGRTWACTACGREAPPSPGRCLYCGGARGPA